MGSSLVNRKIYNATFTCCRSNDEPWQTPNGTANLRKHLPFALSNGLKHAWQALLRIGKSRDGKMKKALREMLIRITCPITLSSTTSPP